LLPGATLGAGRKHRDALITEAMLPSRMTGRWQQYIETTDAPAVRKALDGVSLIEAPSDELFLLAAPDTGAEGRLL